MLSDGWQCNGVYIYEWDIIIMSDDVMVYIWMRYCYHNVRRYNGVYIYKWDIVIIMSDDVMVYTYTNEILLSDVWRCNGGYWCTYDNGFFIWNIVHLSKNHDKSVWLIVL